MLPQLIITVEYNNVIRVIEEAKINLTIWWSINIVNIYIQEMLADFTSFPIKGILSEPTRMFPHTIVSSKYPPITCNRGNKTLSTRI